MAERTQAHARLTQAAQEVPDDVRAVLRRLHDAGHQAFLAGGCVRDVLLGRPSSDYDVTTSALPPAVAELFPKVIPTGIQHGTVTVVTRAEDRTRHVEVTTFRGEGAYLDGRRPASVVFLDDVEKDLARRDFTVNAIAWDPLHGLVADPFDGVGDAARQLIRAVGVPGERFSEDGLRKLRAVRFASVLSFDIDAATKRAIPEHLETFRKVAIERVRDEFTKLLVNSPKPSRGIELLAETGLLAEFLPELLEGKGQAQNRYHRWPVWEHVLQVVDHAPPRLEVRLGALLHDIAKPRCAALKDDGEYSFHRHELVGADLSRELLERLKYPGRTVDAVVHLVREHNWHYRPEWSDGAVRRKLAKLGTDEETLRDFFDLRQADIRGHGVHVTEGLENLSALRERFDRELAQSNALTMKDLAVDGRTLMNRLSLQPGPAVGELLRALLQHVIDHPEDNEQSRLLDEAKRLTPPR